LLTYTELLTGLSPQVGWQRRGREEEAIAAYRRAAAVVPEAGQVWIALDVKVIQTPLGRFH
jgi:hypothetical protein